MANRKEDEKNERIIRNLLKLPDNRRCINCNSLVCSFIRIFLSLVFLFFFPVSTCLDLIGLISFMSEVMFVIKLTFFGIVECIFPNIWLDCAKAEMGEDNFLLS